MAKLMALEGQWGYKVGDWGVHKGDMLSVHEAVALCIRPHVRGEIAPDDYTHPKLAGKPLGVHFYNSGLVPDEHKWPGPASGKTLIFVSHAWNNPLSGLASAVEAAVVAAGGVLADTFVWIDIFAINQWNYYPDLGKNGATLSKSIELANACMLVLDREGVPFTRLWCLHELASIPQSKLQILTHGFALTDLKSVIGKISADEAQSQGDDREIIVPHIMKYYGSLDRFNTVLKLRLLLHTASTSR